MSERYTHARTFYDRIPIKLVPDTLRHAYIVRSLVAAVVATHSHVVNGRFEIRPFDFNPLKT